MSDSAFWNDQEYARDIVQQVKVLKGWIEPFDSLSQRAASARELDELLAMRAGTTEDRAAWKKFRAEMPEVPMQIIEGRTAIAPAMRRGWQT